MVEGHFHFPVNPVTNLKLQSIDQTSKDLIGKCSPNLCAFSSYIIRAIYKQKVLLDQNGFLSAPVLSVT